VKLRHVAAVVATTITLCVGAAAPAFAIDNIRPFGVQETFMVNGALIGYTVTGLTPSSDPVPYPTAGRLYEATVTADALQGTVFPVVPDFNARAESGTNYPVLAGVSSLSGAPLGEGGSTTGKIYFDVVGDAPNSVVYNDGSHDILGWIQPPGISAAETPGGSTNASTGSQDNASTGSPGTSDNSQGVTGSTGPNEASPNVTAPSTGAAEQGSDNGIGSPTNPHNR